MQTRNMTDHFKVGDIVRLTLGNGPEMIVTNFERDNSVTVLYYNEISGLVVEQMISGWALSKTGSNASNMVDKLSID